MSVGFLKDHVSVRGRFHRSVQLARDIHNANALQEYVLTPTARELAGQIVAGLSQPSGERAWSITGPYGTGKSAFALFLTSLLCQSAPTHREARSLRDEARLRTRPFVSVPLVGQRAPFVPSLLTALAESLKSIAPALARRLRKAAAMGHGERDVVVLLEQAAQAANAAKRGGLLIIIDEFGKFLEYVALHPETEDLLVLQQMAETAARSPIPILLITILHSSFAEYLHTADQAQRMEWQKVQGRFADVAFQEPPDQLLRLVGAAIEHTMPRSLETAYRKTVDNLLRSEAWAEARHRFPQRLLTACVPLHPVTALLLWPLFRSKLAQNERSLFAFLTSQEPYGFQEFLTLTKANHEQTPFYFIDRFYDYVVTALGSAIFTGDRAHRWAEISHAIERIGADAPPQTTAAVKAVGLIGMYGATGGLRPSRDVLALALGDPDGVVKALAYLEHASILLYRKHERAYGLWEGSDVDLDKCFEEAMRHVGQGDLAVRLKQLVDLRPVVARAHYIRKGTLRYFTQDIITGSDRMLQAGLESSIAPADGRILYTLTPNARDRKRLMDLAKNLTRLDDSERGLHVLAFPQPVIGLEEAVAEAEGWQWVSQNVPQLQGDPVARREVRSRILQTQERLEGLASRVFGLQGQAFDPNTSEWVQGGRIHRFGSTKQFLVWLSSLCDDIFEAAPVLRNELLNRDRLSSAAAKARRNLLEAMLVHEMQPNLGFVGTPPEVSMYRSLLLDGGFHRERHDRWQFAEPGRPWQPVWRTIHSFLESTQSGRRPLQDLFGLLKRAPFGLRDGPLPVILCAVLLAHRDDVALYEDGLFVPELRIEVVERLLRAPQTFEIQQYTFASRDRKTLEAISQTLQALQLSHGERTKTSPLVRVVKQLTVFAAHLPAYTKNTKRIMPPQAMAVRDTLLRTRDPYSLMRAELPAALQIDVTSERSMTRYPGILREVLLALQRAYPHLLDEVETQVRDVFDLHGTSEEVRWQLQARALPVQGFATDRTLALFVREASRLDEKDDWRTIVGRVVNGGLPPSHWHDLDVVNFQVRLTHLASDFIRLEELVAEQRRSGATQILRIGLLDGKLQEAREIVAVTSERAAAIEGLATQIAAVLDTQTDQSEEARRVRLAALAQVASRYLHRNGSTTDE